MINNFQFYRFLSTDHMLPVSFEGRLYPSVEHAFQAAKSLSEDVKSLISTTKTVEDARRLGSEIVVRSDWEDIKDGVMYEILKSKFSAPELIADLLEYTANQEIVWGNDFDSYWGVCNGVGENRLGKLLMQIREESRHLSITEEKVEFELESLIAEITEYCGMETNVVSAESTEDLEEKLVEGFRQAIYIQEFTAEQKAVVLSAVLKQLQKYQIVLAKDFEEFLKDIEAEKTPAASDMMYEFNSFFGGHILKLRLAEETLVDIFYGIKNSKEAVLEGGYLETWEN